MVKRLLPFSFTALLVIVLANVVAAQAASYTADQCQQMTYSCQQKYNLTKCKEKEAQQKAAVAMEAQRQATAGRAGKALTSADKTKLTQLQNDLAATQKQCTEIPKQLEACVPKASDCQPATEPPPKTESRTKGAPTKNKGAIGQKEGN
jgi:hypothetical protein